MAKRIIPPEEAQQRLGEISNSTFYDQLVRTGRIRLVRITERRVGVLESELDQLIDELAAARDTPESTGSGELDHHEDQRQKRGQSRERSA
ncbi:MAG: helix-turn-helix transcriptional regulator [Xanthobacteraceae bacterium]